MNLLSYCPDIVKVNDRIHSLITDCIAVDTKMLYRMTIEYTAILTLELTKWYADTLCGHRLCHIGQISLKILTAAIELQDQFLPLTIRFHPKFQPIHTGPVDTLEILHDTSITALGQMIMIR